MNQKYHIWKHIIKGSEGDCWPCICKGQDRQGHKLFGVLGKKYYAHRLVYELEKGEIPEGMLIMHLCNNPSCCNPKHLELGTKSQNTKQAYAHNPNLRIARLGHNNGRSKLTAEQITDIRASSDSHESAALRHHVSPSTISRIRDGKRYA